MNTSTNNILDTIISEVNSIDHKIKGLNFLEILKVNLLEKLSFENVQNISLNKFEQIEKKVITNNRYIKIYVKFVQSSFIISKKILEEDTLFMSLNEFSSFDIYENEKNCVNIPLHKNTGMSLPKNTIINAKFNKNVLLIEILYKDQEQILTN